MKNNFWKITEKHCAVITGASSGIGAEFARELGKRGVFLIISGRNEKALKAIRRENGEEKCRIIISDLSDEKSCIDLYAAAKKYNPDILINCAGFGVYGEFTETSLSSELKMIDVNIKAMHILFKLFTRDFVKKDRGYILNVGSAAGLLPGPLMSTYYSSKSYVIRQTLAVYTELLMRRSSVGISVLCPGPVDTEFNSRAGIKGFMKGITARKCVKYTLEKMRKNKTIIIPTFKMQLTAAAVKLAPAKLVTVVSYFLQSRKKKI